MNELQTFRFNNDEVRTAVINDEPYFCLKDVCVILGIKNYRDTVNTLNQKGVVITDTLTNGGVQKNEFHQRKQSL